MEIKINFLYFNKIHVNYVNISYLHLLTAIFLNYSSYWNNLGVFFNYFVFIFITSYSSRYKIF